MGFGTALYYCLKPFLPLRLRYSVRRQIAKYQRRSCPGWPILEAAGYKPEGWPGWPEGKRFAFVLTHDVEGLRGLKRCSDLARFEADLGFRSSFNFIPEGPYVTPATLREELLVQGFEVGVHDLKHDGGLYRSHSKFRCAARKINQYLKEWNAVGFRAGFMFHNLDWLRDLNIQYDASTFDVDPFEPQPDGMETIFPFWVPGACPGQGYVELPYTLCQDSTLFLILREKTIRLWKRKLDWVAARGGMALLNVHPDYICLENRTEVASEFNRSLYGELLSYVQRRYDGQYWHALPRDVAGWYKGTSHSLEG